MQTIAIYSRKSKFTGKGDSIENQIEMCKNYIKNHINDAVEFVIYEDEGFSGSTLNRPQFKKLMKDIKLKQINILICYRLDRISRNVADFSTTLEILQSNNVNFISISEQFDTSTPMGRAMIYIASVFAQLERETIAERVRDNMLELAKNGRWTGGKIPLGFNNERVKYIDDMGMQREYSVLKQDEEEIKFVKFLYEKYLELGSLHKLEVYITQNQLKSRNGIMFEKSSLKLILQNPIYVKANNEVVEYLKEKSWTIYGEVDNVHSLLSYNKTEQITKNGKSTKTLKDPAERFVSVSSIKGALEPQLWLEVQQQFDKNRNTFPALGKTHNALLVGILRCGNCNQYMLVQHGRTSKITGKKIFYYMCSLKRKSKKQLCDNCNAKADYVEKLVIKTLKMLPDFEKEFIKNLENKYNREITNLQNNTEKLHLTKLLEDKKKQIDTLVTILSKGEGIQDILFDKIKDLKEECKGIEQKILTIKNNTHEAKANSVNMKIIKAMLKDCKNIETFDREKQKHIIHGLIDTIYWYGIGGGKGKIKIKFIGSDDDNTEEISFNYDDELAISKLQFCSHSTCKVDDILLSS